MSAYSLNIPMEFATNSRVPVKREIFKLHEKNDFVKVSKNLARYRSEIILLDRQNNYVRHSSWLLECQNLLQYYSLCSNVLHNYFDNPTKLFSDLHLNLLVKFLDTSTKSSMY